MKIKFLILIIFLSYNSFSQSDLQTVLKVGELLLSGLTIFKTNKGSVNKDSKVIESVCVKNKLVDKITFRIVGKNEKGDEIKKELVIQKDGKECLFVLPKGIYKKGEYKFDEEVVITIKDD